MRPKPRPALLVVLLFLSAIAAGCTRAPRPLEADPGPTATRDAAPTDEDPPAFSRLNWTVGQWWSVRLRADFGDGATFDLQGKLVVAKADENGYRITSDNEGINVLDSYFASFFVGEFDRDLNPRIVRDPVPFYRWPLRSNDSWMMPLPAQGFRSFDGTVDTARVNVTTFDEARGLGPRLRMQGSTDAGDRLDYDYSPRTGWMTYFRLRNVTTGVEILGLDFQGTGTGYHGPLKLLEADALYARFAMLPPFGDAVLFLDPANSMVPPTETVEIPDRYAFVEELQALFHYPAGDLVGEPGVPGAAEVAVAVTRPDGTVDDNVYHGFGDQPDGKFERVVVKERPHGTWSVSVSTLGTGGAFVGLFGFREEGVEL